MTRRPFKSHLRHMGEMFDVMWEKSQKFAATDATIAYGATNGVEEGAKVMVVRLYDLDDEYIGPSGCVLTDGSTNTQLGRSFASSKRSDG